MENDSLMAVSSNVDVMVKHLYEDDGCSTSDISQLRIDDLPLAVLGCVASNLPYRDLRTFRVVNRHFYYVGFRFIQCYNCCIGRPSAWKFV